MVTSRGATAVRLLAVEEFHQPDYWCEHNPARATLEKARLRVDAGGVEADVWVRPYQIPVVVNGLRLHGEYTRAWAMACRYAALEHVTHDACLLAQGAAAPWGPPEFVFPLRGYRWRGNGYNNTWLSLVPYNHLYCHRGED